MNYPEMKKNQSGILYRYLETIGAREYWQVNDSVVSAEPGARRLSEGTSQECWPAITRTECPFADWNVHRTWLLRLVDIQPQETQRRYITLKDDWRGVKTVTGAFYTVAGMMGESQIEDLFVLINEYDNDREDCCLWSGCGTDLLVQVTSVMKCKLRTLSEENIRWLIDFKKCLNTGDMAKHVMDSLDKPTGFVDSIVVHWLRTIGYDTSEIEKKQNEKRIRNAERRKQEEEAERLKNEAAVEQKREMKAKSLQILREGIVRNQKLILKDLPCGHEVLVSLFQSWGIDLPLRTKGWVYEKLHSVTGDSYSWYSKSRRERGSETFSVLLGKLREKLIEETTAVAS
jgi:hypothetical protein